MLDTYSTQWGIGTNIGTARGNMIIVNMYIPPVGSNYAPKGIQGYIGTLEKMQEWVYSTQMQRGNIVGIFWVRDFNAHVRDINQQSTAKSDTA